MVGASGMRRSGAVVGRWRNSREVAGLDLMKMVVGRFVKKRRSTGWDPDGTRRWRRDGWNGRDSLVVWGFICFIYRR